MTQRVKQVLVTLVLTTPLAFTTFVTGPFTAATAAQGGQRMVGPNFPVLIDNGDGLPTSADTPASTVMAGSSQIRITTPFTCDGVTTTSLTLSNMSGGRFNSVGRVNGNGVTQALNLSGGTGVFSQATYIETLSGATRHQTAISIADLNGDGLADTFLTSGSFNTSVPMVFAPDSSYVSLPTALAALLDNCASVPQIWVPLADTNGDGRGDSVVFDLDGGGVADPTMWRSPPVGAPAVPAMDTIGLILLTMLLGGISLWFIGRRRPIDATPA